MGSGDSKHMWTVATLDGVTYHIDTTWGDSDDNAVSMKFFAMTPEESMQIHSLNIAYSGTQLPA
jgi:transglutaminase/protease-like cytokinesis protein 3